MSTEEQQNAVYIPVKIPVDQAIPGAKFDLQNGRVMELLTVDEAQVEWKEIEHPIVEVATDFLAKAGKEQSRSNEQIAKGLTLLIATCPEMRLKELWPYLVKAFPVQVTTIVTRAQLGIDDPVELKQINDSYSPANGEQQVVVNLQPKIFMPEVQKEAPPVINFNPQINVPKQDAPIVNVNNKLELPPVEQETINIKRDSSGFIQEATKTRRRKQTAVV